MMSSASCAFASFPLLAMSYLFFKLLVLRSVRVSLRRLARPETVLPVCVAVR